MLGVDTTSKKRRFYSMQIDLIENVKQGLRNIGKRSQTKDRCMARKIMLMFVVKNMTQNRQISSISSEMGFSRKIMREYVKRRLIMDDRTVEGNWAIMCRAPHSDRIEELLKKLVISFWIDNAHPSSNSRDVIRHRIAPGQYKHHTKHWLDTTVHELYVSFCSEHPNVKVKKTLFENLKPYFVRSNKVFETCCLLSSY